MSNILNEELNKMKSLFDYQRGKVISEQESLPGYHKYGPENKPDSFAPGDGADGVDIKYCLKFNKNILDIPTNRAMGEFQDKTQLSWDGNGKIFCSIKLMKEKLAELQNKSSVNSNATPKQAPKVTFTPNDKLPLKFQQKGENIKLLQMKLNMPKNLQTGNFYTKTEEYIKKIVPEYNRTTGVTQEVWDKIFNPKTKPTTPEQTIAPEKNIPTTNAPTNLNAQPANLAPNPALQQKK
jgi:hypothetical protein